MSTTEDRVRAATRAAAQTVAPGSTPPPPPLPERLRRNPAAHPRRGRGWPGWVAPLAAAAAVAAVIAISVVVSGALPLGHASRPAQTAARHTGTVALHPAPAAPAGIPAYNITLAPGPLAGQSTRAVVRATATGAVLATVRAPRPYATFTGVTGAADDRTFVLTAQPGQQPTASGGVLMKFFLLRLDPAAGTARLAALPIPTVSGKWIQGAGIAVSPDGTKLAVALSIESQSVVEVFDLAGGPVREWKAQLPGGNVIGTNLLAAGALSWAADGRTLVFDAWGPARVEVHALDTVAPGTSLSASRLVMTFPNWSTTGSVSGSAIITPDGTKIIAMEVPGPPAGTEIRVRQFSATDGRPLGILATIHYRKGAITGWPDVLWSNPSGSQLIISTTRLSAAPSKNGDLTSGEIGIVAGGRFVPLPGIPGGQRPVW
ncbi:MAG TPA: hypothetical protein VIX86_03885 [Streptosporangiaceae bacterium]